MDFGISLDPLAVSQRHELYDSESEEEEDETGEQNRADPAPEEGSGDFITGRSLIIGLGSTASVFVRSFVCLRESPSLSLPVEAAEIRAGEKNAQSGHEREEIAAVELYETQGNSQWVVCAHSKELRAENCNRWTEKVFGQGKPDHVLVYVCRSLHEYFSSFPVDEDTVNIVRCLCSSSWPHPPGGVALEAPNSIKGEAAAILTRCELQGIPCSVQILYASGSLTETEKSVCLLPSLQQTAAAATLPRGLPIRGEKDAELMVKKLQPRRRTDLNTLYT